MLSPVETGVLETIRESRSSIELSRDAKGDYRWSIKLYFDAQEDDETALIIQLSRLDASLRREYLPAGGKS